MTLHADSADDLILGGQIWSSFSTRNLDTDYPVILLMSSKKRYLRRLKKED